MGPFAAFIAGRRTKYVVLAVWVLALAGTLVAGLPAKFTDAEENSNSSFLPEDAESTRALAVTDRLAGRDVAPTVIVFRREGGLSERDRLQVVAKRDELNAATRRFANTTPFGPPTFSRDRTAALLQNQVEGTGESDGILDPVTAYRRVASDPGGGLEAKVTGPSGVAADQIEVFESINGTLIGAAFVLVIVLLILIYRSPIFWLLPILAVGFAEIAARGFGYGLTELGVTVNGQSSAILSILVIGAGTDYALLLVARYREELRRHEDKHEAMQLALRRAGPAIIASGLTVCVALLALTLAEVNGTAGLGPTGAMGVAVAMLAMLTFLPALLVLVGRWPFWPFIPRFGEESGAGRRGGIWDRLGRGIAARPTLVAAATTLGLLVLVLGLLTFSTGLTSGNGFREDVESIEGQQLVAQAFPQGQSIPTDIILRDRSDIPAVVRAASGVEGVDTVVPRPVQEGPPGVQLAAFLGLDPLSTEAFDVIPRLREAVRRAAPDALVGGSTAIEYDLRQAATRDTQLLIPLTLLIVFVILLALLRAVVAPVLLILTVVLSFFAALGVGALVFEYAFDFPGSDPSLPLFAFIFLVALGVDYNIFLMARVREEAQRIGTHEGMLRGLAVTGGVITSAGVVLAGTFAVLGVLPLVQLTQIGFVVAFGVLLDTLIVRSVLVPALVLRIGPKVWWPSSLARRPEGPAVRDEPRGEDGASADGRGAGDGASAPGAVAAGAAGERTAG